MAKKPRLTPWRIFVEKYQDTPVPPNFTDYYVVFPAEFENRIRSSQKPIVLEIQHMFLPHPYSKWAVFRKPLVFHAKQARFRTQQAKFHRKKLIGAQKNFGPKWPKNQGLPLGEFWWKNIRIRLCPRISLIIM